MTDAQSIELQFSAEQYEIIGLAATSTGLDITEFVVQVAHSAAVRALDSRGFWELSQQAAQLLIDTLSSPPAPSKALQEAAARSRKQLSK